MREQKPLHDLLLQLGPLQLDPLPFPHQLRQHPDPLQIVPHAREKRELVRAVFFGLLLVRSGGGPRLCGCRFPLQLSSFFAVGEEERTSR